MRMQDSKVLLILTSLASHGWISLRSMSALLGYAHPTGIYARQRGSRAISTIRIGGRYRVYADEVVATLSKAPEQDKEAANIILIMYRKLLKEQQDA